METLVHIYLFLFIFQYARLIRNKAGIRAIEKTEKGWILKNDKVGKEGIGLHSS